MPDTWGMLPKSQVDNETIEEAIDRLILAHNNDEAAHLDVGQSLQSHKVSEIIDHEAHSVYQDKIAYDRFLFNTNFDTLDGWQKTAGVTLLGPWQVKLLTTGVINNFQYLTQSVQGINEHLWSFSRLPFWKTTVGMNQNINQLIYIEHGDILFSQFGYGFKIVNGTVYCAYCDGDGVEQTFEVSGITVTNFNRYECEVVSDTEIIFRINDVVVKDWSGITVNFFEGSFIQYYLEATASQVKWVEVQDLLYNEASS